MFWALQTGSSCIGFTRQTLVHIPLYFLYLQVLCTVHSKDHNDSLCPAINRLDPLGVAEAALPPSVV